MSKLVVRSFDKLSQLTQYLSHLMTKRYFLITSSTVIDLHFEEFTRVSVTDRVQRHFGNT